LRYYHADEYRDAEGNRFRIPEYQKWAYEPYLEYGWSETVTLGGSASLERAVQEDSRTTQGGAALGLAELALFYRQELLDWKGVKLSSQTLYARSPVWRSGEVPEIGSHTQDMELKLLAGYGFTLWERPSYINLEAGQRWRIGNAGDQYRFDATLGTQLTDRWGVAAEWHTTLATTQEGQNFLTLQPSNDYDLQSVQLTASYALDDRRSLRAGFFTDLGARNTGEGGGIVFGYGVRF
jgi:hypothetical protein